MWRWGASSGEVLQELLNTDFVAACNALSAHQKENFVLAKENILQAQARQKMQYDRKHVNAPNFQVGTNKRLYTQEKAWRKVGL